MKKILVGILLMLLPTMSFAAITKTLPHNLTIGGYVQNGQTMVGAPINAYTITAGQTITSDSIYQAGSISYGYSALAIIASSIGGGNPNIKLSYQTSYDNSNWFSPVSTNGSGIVTPVATLDSSVMAGNTWIVYNYTVYPYIRFNIQNNAATNDSVTAETVWQDYL